MLAKFAALILVPLLLVGGVVANAQILLVQVHDQDLRLAVPVPLGLLQLALAFAPAELRQVHAPEFAPFAGQAARLLDGLANLPDVVLVEIRETDERVRVAKRSDLLEVAVADGDEESVTINLPIGALAGVLTAYDADAGTFRTSRLVAALRAAPSGPLVRVLDGDEEVSIRVW